MTKGSIVGFCMLAPLLASAIPTAAHADGTTGAAVDLRAVPVPALESLGHDVDDDLIRYGHDLFQHTYRFIGPEVADAEMRYAGNNLACGNCHLDAGTKPFAMPMIGIDRLFPTYRARENKVNTLEERIDGCMERSMNGRTLPRQSREMRALTAYIAFLGRSIPAAVKAPEAKIEGTGLPPLPLLDRAANPDRGRTIYRDVCATCHGPHGEGQRNGVIGDAQGYKYPPLWGDDSFNDGAASTRLLTMARFVHANMPRDKASPDKPVLSVEHATDVSAFVILHPRPHRDKLEEDFPLGWNKPVDAAFPPFADGADAQQHKYGPFGQLMEAMKKLAPKQ